MKRFLPRLAAVFGLAVIIASLLLAASPLATNAAERIDTPTSAPAPAWFGCTYVVRPGDTLFRIGLRFGVSAFTLAFTNGLANPNLIFVGMVLSVPCPSNPPPPPVRPPPNVCNVYIVQRGDWLITIAARFGTTWQAIAAANHLGNPNRIFPGMRLVIPCPGTTPPPTGFCQPGAGSGAIMVRMQNIHFNPQSCKIHMGQTVIWQNFDAVQHTATQGTCTATTCTATSGGFDTGLINPGSNKPITFNSLGTFHYYCMVHGVAMQGDIQVVP